MKRTVTLSTIMDFFGLNIAGKSWDSVRMQRNRTYNTGQVVLIHFSAEMFHIIALNLQKKKTLAYLKSEDLLEKIWKMEIFEVL